MLPIPLFQCHWYEQSVKSHYDAVRKKDHQSPFQKIPNSSIIQTIMACRLTVIEKLGRCQVNTNAKTLFIAIFRVQKQFLLWLFAKKNSSLKVLFFYLIHKSKGHLCSLNIILISWGVTTILSKMSVFLSL